MTAGHGARFERTRQQVDPAVTTGSHIPSVILAIGSVVWAGGVTIVSRTRDDGVGVAGLEYELLALSVLALAALVVAVGSNPLRAPFTRLSHVTVHALVIAAAVILAWGLRGVDPWVRDDWPALSLALLIVAIGAYRPVGEILVFSLTSATAIGAITWIKSDAAATDAPAVAFVVIVVAPLVCVALGVAASTAIIIASLERQNLEEKTVAAAELGDVTAAVIKSVQRDRVSVLGRDVSPFFDEVIKRGQITASDRERARAISDDIRGIMVSEAGRSWLDLALGSVVRSGEWPHVVDDRHGLADSFSETQRRAIRALFIELDGDQSLDRIAVRLTKRLDRPFCVISVALGATAHDIHSRYDAVFAVLRIAFPALNVDVTPGTIIARFRIDQG
ncbi:hypothetical protein [Marisediminicola sp. LYQ134]|uniref:hypothetical protein n=1 Tax=unclassified Marisediminicola TaxID=2618316 RepID=UPI0039831FC9